MIIHSLSSNILLFCSSEHQSCFYMLFLKFVCYKMKSDIQDPSINCSIFKVVWLAVKTNHNLYYVSKHLFQIILHTEIILTDKLLLISCWDCKYKITKLHYQSDESYSNAIDQLNFNISIIILHVTAAYQSKKSVVSDYDLIIFIQSLWMRMLVHLPAHKK